MREREQESIREKPASVETPKVIITDHVIHCSAELLNIWAGDIEAILESVLYLGTIVYH